MGFFIRAGARIARPFVSLAFNEIVFLKIAFAIIAAERLNEGGGIEPGRHHIHPAP